MTTHDLLPFFLRWLKPSTTIESESQRKLILNTPIARLLKSKELNISFIVCPSYNDTYDQVKPDISRMASRALKAIKALKISLYRQIRYSPNVQIRILVFDREDFLFANAGLDLNDARKIITGSVNEINRAIRKTGIFPVKNYFADLFVGNDNDHLWNDLFAKVENEALAKHEPAVSSAFTSMRVRFRKFKPQATEEELYTAFRQSVATYLTARNFFHRRFGSEALFIDLGSFSEYLPFLEWDFDETNALPTMLRITNAHTTYGS